MPSQRGCQYLLFISPFGGVYKPPLAAETDESLNRSESKAGTDIAVVGLSGAEPIAAVEVDAPRFAGIGIVPRT